MIRNYFYLGIKKLISFMSSGQWANKYLNEQMQYWASLLHFVKVRIPVFMLHVNKGCCWVT